MGERDGKAVGDPRQAGFSLIELMMAMVITLIVSGAIYGLLTGGQSAFRREPEMTDRQQNIRVAMSLIKRDVAGAGAGMAPFVQAFTNGLNGAGGPPSTTQVSGSSGNPTDVLEVLTATGRCRFATLANGPAPPSGGPLQSNETLSACFPDINSTPSFFFVGSPTPAERNAYGVVMGKGNVAKGTLGFSINLFSPGVTNRNPVAPNPVAGWCGTVTSCTVTTPIDVVRYQIHADPNDPTVPSLWRSSTGVFDSTGNNVGGPPAGNWQVVARGIEDLRIQYLTGGGWANTPGNVYCALPCNVPTDPDLNRIVRQVQITISARATGALLQGSTGAAGNAGNAIRGQLVAVVAPRAALEALSLEPGSAVGWY